MFKKAERKLAKLRLGICGPSGSGKTWSALLIASGITDKIALLDTERRGHLYAGDFNYDICELDAPYSPERYIESIKNAEKAGYEMLIIDSLSHAWMGEGGVLSISDKAGGTFQQGWKIASPKHNALIDTIITSKLHIILTLRTKTAYVVEANEKGKMAPRKVGIDIVQRDGVEYECTLFMEMTQEHYAKVTKDNTRMYDQQWVKPSKEMGEHLLKWLSEGKTPEEIHEQDLANITNKLSIANDVSELESCYRKVVNEYPYLKDAIIPIASKIKENLNERIAL